MKSLQHSLSQSKFKWADFFFYFFILILLANRIVLFFYLNTEYIDSDQPTMWLGARDFSEGLFHEPRYYGQNYNTLLEGLLAAPLIRLGMPVYLAVPLITHLLFLTPFLFTAFYLFRTGKKSQSLLVLGLLLCLPTSYDIMTSLPRGFITGLFFTTPFILSIQHPKNLRYLLLTTFSACVAYLVNQNSLVVSVPFLFYLFLCNYPDKKYYLYSFIAILLAAPLAYLLDYFYVLHPEYVHHKFSNSFALDYFTDAIKHLDRRFAHITFFSEERSFTLLLVFLFCGILLFKKNKKAFYAFLLFLVFILVSFFSSKVADGLTWAFYSYSRMYLGVPVVLYLFLSAVPFSLNKSGSFLISLVLLFTVYKSIHLQKSIASQLDEKKWLAIHLTSVKSTLDLIDHYKKTCEKENVKNLVVADVVWCREELCYGGPAVYKNFPNTLMTVGERRTWRINEEKKKITNRFVLLTTDYDFDKKGLDSLNHFSIKRLDDYGCFLIENNSRSIAEFLEVTGNPINRRIEN